GAAERTATRVDRYAGRAIGPANVVTYVAFVALLYIETPHATRIHWFFFVLAAVQAVLGAAHRRFGNPDHALYPALAVVFATIGASDYLGALALNQVLALEALALLLVAHRTRVWTFHLLAQAVLAANFVHYWLVSSAAARWPEFLGGLLVAAVYLVKAG